MNCRKLLCNLILPAFFLLLSNALWAQTKTVTGRVTDAAGAGLSGVSVTARGSNSGTSTSADGSFSITVPTATTMLTFSSVGYASQEINLGSANAINVRLQTTSSNLNEVVVVGYGTARKKDLTGAVTAISSKDFQKGQITTPEQLIAGKVAGVQITSNGGAPGAGSTIRIRGGASLNASNDPLIVIDGVPLDNNSISGAANPLAMINPNDIETFNILKDASAAAIYGSRASNGVIIITTKKGKVGKPRFNFNTQLSAATPANQVDVLSANEFRTYVNQNGTAEQKAFLGSENTNWQDEIYQTGITTDNNLSMTGGLGKIPFRASLGYLNQTGILRTGKLQRTSLGFNMSPQLFDNHLRIDLNLKGSLSASRFANESAIGNAVTFDPTQPIHSKSSRFGGYYEYLDPASATGLRGLAPLNPVGLLEQRDDQSDVQRSVGNVVFDYKFHFLPDLRANLNLGYDISKGQGTVVIDDSAASSYMRHKSPTTGKMYGGQNTEYEQHKQNLLTEFYLNYAKDIRSIRSRVDAIAGYGYQDFKTTNYNFPDKTYRDTIVSVPNFPFDEPRNTLISFYGRLNYTLMDRYLLTATVRRDGSSRFNEENRWGTFPSLAFAWRMKEENFLKNSKVFSDLKLRVGYGVTGQQEGIGLYDYISYYSLSNNQAQYQIGNSFYNLYRPGGYYANRKWEQTATTNVGLDFGFIDNRITGSVEYYFKKTTDLLNEIPQSAGTNFSNKIVANVGSMENRGVEFNINADAVRNANLTWNVNFNATYNKGEITQLNITDDPSFLGNRYFGIGGTGRNIKINSVGNKPGSFFVLQQVYDANGKPIDGLFEDRNRDGVINDKDMYQYKSANPDLFFGFSTNLTYKNWNAGVVMRANVGNYMYNQLNASIGSRSNVFATGYLRNAYSDLLNTNFSGTKADYYFSDYFVQNASFLRMDNLNIGYNMGKVFSSNANLRLNAGVQNVFTITKYKGLDPEISTGVDNNFYPRPRTFTIGANLEF
ncbi:SusC/RagA family TonB-linked outer membrane protein [Flavisolibacter tropicus]|uniref:Membrane protein n=1 Tax=Flavisolibacter tropicus TaxID=1492898 RepID=A0A172TZA4_9BACT|nr:TonB-dependent receptor [Flavisolibacter tropicus]ANE52077.1 membrane protein [Flavisolibacter tropicus]